VNPATHTVRLNPPSPTVPKPQHRAVRRPAVGALVAFAGWLAATPTNAAILWQHPQPVTVRGNAVEMLHGEVTPRDDSASGTLYFKFRVDPLSDTTTKVQSRQPYHAGLVFRQNAGKHFGVGNASDAWGYSAFSSSFKFPKNKPGELTLSTDTPEVEAQTPYLAPRRGIRTTLVVKVDFVPGGEDLVTVWLNPNLSPGATETNQSDQIVTRFKVDASFDQIDLVHRGIGDGWVFDNLAIATAFEDFVPVPFWRRSWVIGVAALAGLCLMAAVVVTLERRRARRQLLAMERVQAVAAERVRIAQDLHDDLGAKVTEIVLMGELAKTVRDNPREERSQMDAILGELRQLHASLDEAVWSINPRHDSLVELVEFVSEFAGRFLRHAPVEFHLEVAKQMPDVELSSTLRHNFLLAVKEALNNAVRHARATTIRLRIGVENGQLCACVADDGRGMEEAAVSAGDGLRNLRARLEAIGGTTTVRSAPGAGTEVTFRLPLPSGKSKIASDSPAR
jgi:signal transduction histidine kinase